MFFFLGELSQSCLLAISYFQSGVVSKLRSLSHVFPLKAIHVLTFPSFPSGVVSKLYLTDFFSRKSFLKIVLALSYLPPKVVFTVLAIFFLRIRLKAVFSVVFFFRGRLKAVLSRCSSLSSVNSTDDTTVLAETNGDSDTGMVGT